VAKLMFAVTTPGTCLNVSLIRLTQEAQEIPCTGNITFWVLAL
jgi:hypothetical protein